MYCKNCKIDVYNNNNVCPLCNSTLSGMDNSYYPIVEKPKKLKVANFSQFFLIVYVLLAVLIIPINLLVVKGCWGILTMATVLTAFVFLRHTLFSRNSIYTKSFYFTLSLYILLYMYEFLLHASYVIVCFVIPVLLTICAGLVFFTLLFGKNKQGELQALNLTLLTIPQPFVCFGHVPQLWFIASVLSFVINCSFAVVVLIKYRAFFITHIKKVFSID